MTNGNPNPETSEYHGNIMTHAWIAMRYFTDDWGILQLMGIFKETTIPFAKGEMSLSNNTYYGCNSDANGHVGKVCKHYFFFSLCVMCSVFKRQIKKK